MTAQNGMGPATPPNPFSFHEKTASGSAVQAPPSPQAQTQNKSAALGGAGSKTESRNAPPNENPDESPDESRAASSGVTGTFSEFRDKRKAKRKANKSRRVAAREAWRQTGVGWRVFPRTLLGIVVALLMLGVGAGISGAVLFAYYEARVAESENKIVEFSANLDERIAQGIASIEESSATAQQRLDATLGPYTNLLQAENGIPQVVAPIIESTALLTTKNTSGEDTVGTATAVGQQDGRTILLTDYLLVEASTADPKPEITLRKGDDQWAAELVSWDEELGLAFLLADTPLPPAPFSPTQELGSLTGSPVFALSALGGAVSPGAVLSVTEEGFRHTSVIDVDFMGGPIVNQRGEIVGFSTSGYNPANIEGTRLLWAPTIVQICETLLVCDNGNATPR